MSEPSTPPSSVLTRRRYLRAGEVFSPGAPIDKYKLFAGRLTQLASLADSLFQRGQHAVVYGERGVGKTSLVSILSEVVAPEGQIAPVVARENCHAQDSFGGIWKRLFEGVRFTLDRPGVGFDAPARKTITTLAERVSATPTPDEVVRVLRQINQRIVFVIDEFDTVLDRGVAQAFADTLKALSDHAVPSKVILVGVGDNVDALIEAHASVERAIVQIRMPRMEEPEQSEIVMKAMGELGMSIEEAALARVIRMSQGLPHYVHLLGLHSVRDAINADRLNVTMQDVDRGIALAVENAQQSLRETYLSAVSSQRKDSLFKYVLLACALAHRDELAFFTPAAIRAPLLEMGRDLDIPAFASHLNKFASPERGDVLEKRGAERKYRYRFRNPLLEPFVVMRGVSDKVIPVEAVERILAHAEPNKTRR